MTAQSPLAPTFTSLEQALKYYFGYDRFRPGQKAIVEAVVRGQDVLAVIQNGGGRSLCFQLPALLRPGPVLVIATSSDYVEEQVRTLNDNGISASYIGPDSLNQAKAIDPALKLLYLTLDDFKVATTRALLEQIDRQHGISAIAVIDADNVMAQAQPIAALRQRWLEVPMVAIATILDQSTYHPLVKSLGLRSPFTYIGSLDRSNLYYEVRPKQRNSYSELLQQVRQLGPSRTAVVYCLNRRRVDELTYRLQQDGVEAIAYHSELQSSEQQEHRHQFNQGKAQILVAASGMPIRKPDLAAVIHYDLPPSLERYYQESGQAGRDGESAHCTLYFSYGDTRTAEQTAQSTADPNDTPIARQQLRQVIQYAEGIDCRRRILLNQLGERFEQRCGLCDNCLHPYQQEDQTIDAQKFLSCVARCKESFGMTYIIDVLRGSTLPRILRNGHQHLSTYGIGRDRSADFWQRLGRSLLHQGLLDETTDGYAVLKLNALSWEVLRNQRTVMVAVNHHRDRSAQDLVQPQANSEVLLDRLRSLRYGLAQEQSIPPYSIFTDATLRQMVEQRPQSLEQFAQISGVSQHKLNRYGNAFVNEIRRFY